MALLLRNLQRAVPVRRAPLRRRLQLLRAALGVQRFDLAVVCVDNRTIRRLNGVYRARDAPTDVLSFPFHENVKAGELPQPETPDDYNLGDIFLGVEYIFQHCKGDEDYFDILTVTATHGLCHLLGFTHSTEAEWQKLLGRLSGQNSALPRTLGPAPGIRLQPSAWPPRPHPVGNQVPRLTRAHVRRLTRPELVRAGRRQMPTWGSWDTWVRSLPGPGPQTPHYRVTPMHGLAEEKPPRPSGFDPGGLLYLQTCPRHNKNLEMRSSGIIQAIHPRRASS